MTRPLYKDEKTHALTHKPETAHLGLWFDKFFNGFIDHWQIDKDKDVKHQWINTVVGKAGDPERLQAMQAQQTQWLQAINGQCRAYKTQWHFVSGMGLPHPVENGFSWHPTLGVPYLPGCAVKGLLRAWVENDAEQATNDEAKEQNWFGDEQHSGQLLFFDALPYQPPTLVCDIMTPHYAEWYSQGGTGKPEQAPADWHEPNPIPFLAVKDLHLVFAIAQRQTGAPAIDLNTVLEQLNQALEWLGAGAKTAAGYGYFADGAEDWITWQDDWNKRLQAKQLADLEQLRIKSLNDEQKEIDALNKAFQRLKAANVKQAVGGSLYTDLKKLIEQAEHWPPPVKAELLSLAQQIIEWLGAKKNANAKALLARLSDTK